MTWFRLNIGRARNADPKWILPLICTAGGISKAEIGAIKIFDRETRFQIASEHADQFAEMVRTAKHKQGQISRVSSYTSDDDAAVAAALDALPPSPGKPPESRGEGQARFKKPWKDRERSETSSRFQTRKFGDRKKPRDERGAQGHAKPAHRKGPDEKYLAKRKHRAPQEQ